MTTFRIHPQSRIESTLRFAVDNPRDLWAGLLYLGIGAAALTLSQTYPFGSVGRMGPGFFPTILSGLLILFGVISIGRSLARHGEAIDGSGVVPLLYLIAGNLLFAQLLRPLGLIASLAILGLVAASASTMFRWNWRALLGLTALVAACAIVFSVLLNIPMPLLGHWIAGG